jgi:UDP-N-acetylglucosamine 1-carboxyvinyltransferase
MTEDAWRIVGGVPLRGTVRPSGSKNGALPTLAATLLLDGETTLHNVPRIADVVSMLELLRALGLRVDDLGAASIRITNSGLSGRRTLDDLVGEMRASHYILGPVVHRLGQANIPLPGGCRIGSRPVEHFLDVLRRLGVEARQAAGRIDATASGFRGATVTLDARYRNPGATFTALMAGAVAEGDTVVENASHEPDVVAFCHFLNAAGAHIAGVGGPTLAIRGVDRLAGVSHHINTDRLEAGTLLFAAAATQGDVTVESIRREDLESPIEKLEEAGVEVSQSGDGLRACCPSRPRAVSVRTEPFPGFPTDLQPVFAALLVSAEGEATIEESIYDNRLQYADELRKMGAHIRLASPRRLHVAGVSGLRGADVEAHNIREGAALVVAALAAEGESRVSGRSYISRGYQDIDVKLGALGATVSS